MIRKFFRNLLLSLLSPIRYAVRYELARHSSESLDLKLTMMRRASESAADYIAKYMSDAVSRNSKKELQSFAFNKADISNNKLICEFGVYAGKSINHIASLTDQMVYGFDSFEGLPEQWRDGFGKGSFTPASIPEARTNVVLIKGWFENTLPEFIKEHDEEIGFLNIDCDLYSSTKTIFKQLGNRIKEGCIIVFDEYLNYPGWEEGEFLAFQEFIKDTGYGYEYICYFGSKTAGQVAVKIKGS